MTTPPPAAAPAVTDDCPGRGLCHGCMKWCDECGDVKHVCDARLEGRRCDEHPKPVDVGVLRTARRAAEAKIRAAETMLREGKADLVEVEDQEAVSRAFAMQIQAQDDAFWKNVGGSK